MRVKSSLTPETQVIDFRYLQYNHTIMKTINQRHQILESLSALDNAETEKVLDYIKNLLYSKNDLRRQVLKSRALTEIRQALGNPIRIAQ